MSGIDAWPAVGVVVCTRDRPQLVRRAVASVLSQDYPGRLECLVVVDDGSPTPADDLADCREPHAARADRVLTVVANGRQRGLAGARNTGVQRSTAPLLAFCDDDDEWLPTKLTAQVRVLREHPEASLVATGITIVTPQGRMDRPAPEVVTLPQLLRSRVAAIHPSSFLLRRADLVDLGLVNESVPFAYGEDYDLMLRLSRRGPVVGVPDCLTVVHWDRLSFFNANWEAVAAGLSYILDTFPEFDGDRIGRARIRGQVAFACAALGRRREALRWARLAWRDDPRQLRSYGAAAVAARLVGADRLVERVNATGRGL